MYVFKMEKVLEIPPQLLREAKCPSSRISGLND